MKLILSKKLANQKQGQYFEQLALDFLQQQGLILITKNWQQAPLGELDLVMLAPTSLNDSLGETLIFIEVRYRQSDAFGGALASITKQKQRKLLQTAQAFLQQHETYQNLACRFDVLAFDGNTQPMWIQGAFYGDE